MITYLRKTAVLGHNIPIMGIKKSKSVSPPPAPSMADALFSKGRQRVLAVLFGEPDRSFFTTEVIALAHAGSGAVQRELTALADAGLLTITRQGHQKHYQANGDSPVFMELHWLVVKTMNAGPAPT